MTTSTPTGAWAHRSPLTALDAGALLDGYRRRELSPVEVVEAILERIEEHDPAVNAYVTVTAERARAEARAAERAYAAAGPSGAGELPALLGVPYSVKDNVLTAGVRTTMGSRALADWVPDTDAPAVERMSAAGAILLGKTNTPEFGWKAETTNQLRGTTRNPWDLARTPGGSSGGAAVAVALGMGPLALGTDAAGSIRIPGAFCGVVGFKPSFGRIPLAPGGPLESLGHIGLLARSVRDVALALEVVAGPDPRDRLSLPAPVPRCADALEEPATPPAAAWSADLGFAAVDAAAVAPAERAARALAPAAWELSELELAADDPGDVVEILLAAAMAGGVGDGGLEAVRETVDPERLPIVERGFALSAADVGAAIARRARFAEALHAALAGRELLITPAVATAPFAAGRTAPESVGGRARPWLSWAALSYPFNLTGQPAISVPCGVDGDGLPVGLQLVGPQHDDLAVLRAAAAVERRLPWSERWPVQAATGSDRDA